MPLSPAIVIPGTFQTIALTAASPWGHIQNSEILMSGLNAQDRSVIPLLWQVSTASHGGTRVHDQLAAQYFTELPATCHAYGGSRLWFEEDGESTVPFYIFYNGLTPDCWLIKSRPYPRHRLLQDSLQRYYPETIPAVQRIAQRFDQALIDAGIALRTPLTPLDTAA